MPTAEALWQTCVEVLRTELPDGVWNTWFASAEPLDLRDHRLILTVANPVAKERIESRYLAQLERVLTDITGEPHDLVLEVRTDPADNAQVAALLDAADHEVGPMLTSSALSDTSAGNNGAGLRGLNAVASVEPSTTLNDRYTFDAFVCGDSNRFAHAASLAVAEAPAKSWNPLFIHGGVGLGKTHLLHAIGNYVVQNYPAMHVRYVTTETFLNEFVNAIRNSTLDAFKRRFRECHVLLVDDVQFIEKKERLQEEFFHTFDFLHSSGRQIVISSDRAPKAISTLEARLRSRFAGGLITDIQAPDLETRLAILYKKAETTRVAVPDEVFTYIATSVTDNIRELEGALTRVTAFANLQKVDLTLSLAEDVLADMIASDEPRPLTPQAILDATAEMFGLSLDDICGKSRSRPLVNARQIGMYVFREMTNFSYPAIGRVFGNRDHTTVMHAVEKIRGLMGERRAVYDQVTTLMHRIRARG